MKPEEHIFEWIKNSYDLYRRLEEIYRRRQNDCADGMMSAQGVATSAAILANSAYREMLIGGEILRDNPYSAVDLLRAAVLIAEWEVEA